MEALYWVGFGVGWAINPWKMACLLSGNYITLVEAKWLLLKYSASNFSNENGNIIGFMLILNIEADGNNDAKSKEKVAWWTFCF